MAGAELAAGLAGPPGLLARPRAPGGAAPRRGRAGPGHGARPRAAAGGHARGVAGWVLRHRRLGARRPAAVAARGPAGHRRARGGWRTPLPRPPDRGPRALAALLAPARRPS